jgi:hypothetical protein
MVAYSFKRQFVDPIRSGTKAQTIRGRRIRPHAVPGDALQLYCGMRTKGCFLIARATCREVSPIRIVLRTWEIEIDGEELTPPEKAERFAYMYGADEAIVAFELSGRHYAFHLPLPRHEDYDRTALGKLRSAGGRDKVLDQALRSRWRALLLIIRAKFEAVDAGVTTIEDEFLAHTVTPSGRTVGDVLRITLAEQYAGNEVPLLPPPPRRTSAG